MSLLARRSPDIRPGEAVPRLGGPKGLARAVAVFDAAVDRRVDRVRGNPTLDRVMYTASELGNFSLIWHLFNTTRAVAPDRRLSHAVRVATVLGLEAVVVNGPVKNVFRRHRPVWEHERPLRLRVPKTSSFPSGHASSAAVAAGLLSERDNAWPLYYGAGAIVAASRVYVGVHHASDVVAGAVLGVAMAKAAQRLWRFPALPGER
ncbi:MAG TPA: phosphatase PAP2 family protein [Acidimicrobiales bacterium]|nr:phosphatase PAP2 family protein [Acidimicrobiales bacterium]